jgi:hypothetical protein
MDGDNIGCIGWLGWGRGHGRDSVNFRRTVVSAATMTANGDNDADARAGEDGRVAHGRLLQPCNGALRSVEENGGGKVALARWQKSEEAV